MYSIHMGHPVVSKSGLAGNSIYCLVLLPESYLSYLLKEKKVQFILFALHCFGRQKKFNLFLLFKVPIDPCCWCGRKINRNFALQNPSKEHRKIFNHHKKMLVVLNSKR